MSTLTLRQHRRKWRFVWKCEGKPPQQIEVDAEPKVYIALSQIKGALTGSALSTLEAWIVYPKSQTRGWTRKPWDQIWPNEAVARLSAARPRTK